MAHRTTQTMLQHLILQTFFIYQTIWTENIQKMTKMLILEVLVNGWAGKTPNTGKVYSSKHKILLQGRVMLWKKFSYLLLQNLLSFTLKASCLFRLVLLTNTSKHTFYYSKASASLLTKQNSTLDLLLSSLQQYSRNSYWPHTARWHMDHRWISMTYTEHE